MSAKSSFLNKKFLIALLILVLLTGAGVGAYFIFRPTADLSAPYETTYNLYQNKEYNKTLKYTDSLIDILNNSDFSELTEQQIELNDFKLTYQIYKNAIYCFDNIEQYLYKDLIFTKDFDKNFYKNEKTLKDLYKKIENSSNSCIEYYDLYLTKESIEGYESSLNFFQKIENFNNLYSVFFNDVTNYFNLVGEIYKNYLIETISANKYSKYTIYTICNWTKGGVSAATSSKSNVLASIVESSNNLVNFVKKHINLISNNYYNNMEFYDSLFNCFNYVDITQCINALVFNAYDSFVNTLPSDVKTYAISLKENYFF